MSWDEVWKILNSNLVILFLGSGLGFLFVKIVWEPYKEREKSKQRQQSFRDEVAFRLLYIEENLEGDALLDSTVEGGTYAHYLDPQFQSWSLPGLVYSGWGMEAMKKCRPCFESLKLDSTNRNVNHEIDLEDLAIAKDSLAKSKGVLGLA